MNHQFILQKDYYEALITLYPDITIVHDNARRPSFSETERINHRSRQQGQASKTRTKQGGRQKKSPVSSGPKPSFQLREKNDPLPFSFPLQIEMPSPFPQNYQLSEKPLIAQSNKQHNIQQERTMQPESNRHYREEPILHERWAASPETQRRIVSDGLIPPFRADWTASSLLSSPSLESPGYAATNHLLAVGKNEAVRVVDTMTKVKWATMGPTTFHSTHDCFRNDNLPQTSLVSCTSKATGVADCKVKPKVYSQSGIRDKPLVHPERRSSVKSPVTEGSSEDKPAKCPQRRSSCFEENLAVVEVGQALKEMMSSSSSTEFSLGSDDLSFDENDSESDNTEEFEDFENISTAKCNKDTDEVSRQK